jgi:hypothetical protein
LNSSSKNKYKWQTNTEIKGNANQTTLRVHLTPLKMTITKKTQHMMFGLLGQANLTQNDVLQFHPFTSE